MIKDKMHKISKAYEGSDLNGMKTVYVENESIRIGVLADRGADIFEIFYKPLKKNLLLRLDKPIQNPAVEFSQRRDTLNQFEDYYYGGWQSIFPNSAPMNYFGAHLGQHGEVWQLPWKVKHLECNENHAEVSLEVHTVRLPFRVQKDIRLRSGSQTVEVQETLKNTAAVDLPYMWGQHIAFGQEVLGEGGLLEVNASQFESEPSMPEKRLVKAGQKGKWPHAMGLQGQEVRLDQISKVQTERWSELLYLSGFQKEGKYTLLGHKDKLSITVSWPTAQFPFLWFWEERYGMQYAPWWGNVYAVGLEPWTNAWSAEPQSKIDRNIWPVLKSGAEKTMRLSMNISEGENAESN